jgi:phenylalanyl-tRNA synthetase beta chain
MQEDSNQMRTSLLPGLLRAAKTNNSRTLVSLSLYEIGSVFLPAKSDSSVVLPSANGRPSEAELGKLLDSIPNQPMMLGVLYTGDRIGQQVGRKSVKASYADAISLVRSLSELLAVEIKIEQSNTLGYHPGRTAVLKIEDKVIGFAGEIHPEISIALDLPRQVAALELNLDLLFAATPDVVGAKPIYTFPAATQDLSLVLNQEIPAALVLETIRKAAGELLEEVVLVDDFRGGNLAADEKSLTFALRFRASDRTLTQAEASAAKEQAVAEANKLFGATLRS